MPRPGHRPASRPDRNAGASVRGLRSRPRRGTDGCQVLFDEETARAYGDPRFAARRRMIVDAYSLQHPDRYCVSAISLAAHLTGLCVAVEHPGREVALNAAIQRWLSRRPPLEKPQLPVDRGDLTIARLRAVTDPGEHARAAEAWARATWATYSGLHDIARRWIAEVGSSRLTECSQRRRGDAATAQRIRGRREGGTIPPTRPSPRRAGGSRCQAQHGRS
jgi:hypothetical protein